MGFSTLLDIIGSTIIGGMLILILFRLNDSAVENTYTYGEELVVQQNLVEVVTLLEYDFRKIGYCADYQQLPIISDAIISADSTDITFWTDLPESENGVGDGTLDQLRYFVSDTSVLNSTPNPRDIMLYRVVNGATPKGSNLGVTEFKLRYFNSLGVEIDTPVLDTGEIASMEISITIESTMLTENWMTNPEYQKYVSSYWRQVRLSARNLRNR